MVGELAGHLEECYARFRASGMNEEQAIRETCVQAGDWEELRRGIASARLEGSMSDGVKQIWLPGLVTLLSSYVVLALLQWAGMQPGRIVFFYTPWLIVLLINRGCWRLFIATRKGLWMARISRHFVACINDGRAVRHWLPFVFRH
jgi:hypothetical protein